MSKTDDELIELTSRLLLQRSARSLVNDLARFGLAAPSWAPALKRGERMDYVVCLPLDYPDTLQLPDSRRGRSRRRMSDRSSR